MNKCHMHCVQASVRVGDLELSAEEEFQVKIKNPKFCERTKRKVLFGWLNSDF